MNPFDWTRGYPSQRLPIFGRNVVATSHPQAAQAGLRMLQNGGNAVDAAIATAAAMTILEPVSNGLGSDAFALIWDGQALHGLNASGCAPRAWTPEYFARKHGTASLTLFQQAWRAGTLIAEGDIRIGCVDEGTFKPRRIPTEVLATIT